MIFYSDKFYYDGLYSQDLEVLLVSESSEVLNEYGISYMNGEEKEITLSFCYVDSTEQPLPWNSEKLESVLGWLITDEYKEFISEDNDEVTYFLKGVGYTKRFTADMRGLIDVTFKALSCYGYRNYIKEIKNPTGEFVLTNSSNINKTCKPVIELNNISSETIQITNLTTNRTPFIVNTNSSKSIIIDNETGVVINDNNENLIMDCNRKWIELGKGDNTISVEGNCDIVFKVHCPVMV